MKKLMFGDEFERKFNIGGQSRSTFPNLETLVLHRNLMTSEGVEEIKQNWRDISPHLRSLVIHPQTDEEDPYQELLKKVIKPKKV